jgi:hypothetical protein
MLILLDFTLVSVDATSEFRKLFIVHIFLSQPETINIVLV